jgi:hypothetical protein
MTRYDFLSSISSYNDVINSTNKPSVIAWVSSNIASQLAIDQSRISNMSVQPGSIIVTFVLLPGSTGQQNVQNLTNTLRDLVQSGNFAVTLPNGQRLNVYSTSFLVRNYSIN